MPNLLERVERALGGLIEAPMERLFTRRLHPVHLARRLEEAMVDAVLVSSNGTVAPAYFIVWLDLATYQRFAGAREGVQHDLEQHLLNAAASRELRFLQSPQVELQIDPDLDAGRFEVETAFLKESGDVGAEEAASEPT